MDRPCSARTEAHPLVAHCIVGAVRSFLRHPSLQESIKWQLFHSTSPRYRAFMVASLNCTHGAAVGTNDERAVSRFELSSRDCSSNTTGMPEAIARMPLESFTIATDEVATSPSPQCMPQGDSEAYEKYTSYFYMFAKAKTCYEQVVQYEKDTGVCFDWVVKTRPDDMWLSRAPELRRLPHDKITVPSHWSGLVGLTHIVEDHTFVIPRHLASTFFNAIDGWSICPTMHELTERCPFPFRGYQNKTRVMQSECILGHYLNLHNITWQNNPKFRYRTFSG